jgi:diadenosine tetraphosphate (Ap4A) HIT family hydrolase
MARSRPPEASSSSECSLCRELSGSEAVRDELRGAAAVASLGALTEAHALVCPIEHARAVALLDTAPAGAVLSFALAVADVLSDVARLPVHLFEHGNGANNDGVGCSTEHAHIHAVAANVDPWPQLAADGAWEEVDFRVEPIKARTAGHPYLLYRSPAGHAYICLPHPSRSVSQLIRRRFATALGRADEWNWRQHPAPSRVAATSAILTQVAATGVEEVATP